MCKPSSIIKTWSRSRLIIAVATLGAQDNALRSPPEGDSDPTGAQLFD